MSRTSYNLTNMALLIRFAHFEDIEVLYVMLCDLENEMLDKKRFTEVFRKNLENKNITYLIAELDNRVVGMASCHVQLLLHHSAPVAEIQEMYVEAELRSQGIGQRLIEEILVFARKRGADYLEVTSNETRAATHRFYKREGFQKTHVKMVRKGLQE
jgi:(aminoalkyl)phosphonate N-acetyltransferase